MPSKHLLLELQQLDHQAGQGLVGRGLRLDVLGEEQKSQWFWFWRRVSGATMLPCFNLFIEQTVYLFINFHSLIMFFRGGKKCACCVNIVRRRGVQRGAHLFPAGPRLQRSAARHRAKHLDLSCCATVSTAG